MKAQMLIAALAVTFVSGQAQSKGHSPPDVLADWNRSLAETAAPLVGSLGLQAQVADQRYPGLTKIFESPANRLPGERTPPAPRYYNAPTAPQPTDPANVMPRGAKRWRYQDRDYWLVPLGN